jgi:hypothetical protein
MRCSYLWMNVLLLGVIACDGSPTPQLDGEPVESTEGRATVIAPGGDAADYAARYGVPLDEAAHRLDQQVSLGDIEVALRKTERTFAGLWIQHEPTYKIIVALTDPAAAPRAVAVVHSVAKAGDVEFRTARFTLAELEQHQLDTIATTRALGVPTESDVSVLDNRVELYVRKGDQTQLASKLGAAGQALAASVHIVPVDQFSSSMQLNGGVTLYKSDGDDPDSADDPSCTAGFTVRTTQGHRGFVTAAHCPDRLRPNASSPWLPVTDQLLGGHHDVQWHSTCGIHDVSDDFYKCSPFTDPACLQDVAATVHRNNQVIGAVVKKFGWRTDVTDGTIHSKNFCPVDPFVEYEPTFIRVTAGSTRFGYFGDSGAPVFSNGNAYGILKGAPPDNINDGVYMPINYVSDLFIQVNTSDPSGPGCTICDPAGFACSVNNPSTCCSNACVPTGVGGLGKCG